MTKKEWYNYVKRRSEIMKIKEQLMEQEINDIKQVIDNLKNDLQFNKDFIEFLLDEYAKNLFDNLFIKDALVHTIYDNIRIVQRIKKLNKRLNELSLTLNL